MFQWSCVPSSTPCTEFPFHYTASEPRTDDLYRISCAAGSLVSKVGDCWRSKEVLAFAGSATQESICIGGGFLRVRTEGASISCSPQWPCCSKNSVKLLLQPAGFISKTYPGDFQGEPPVVVLAPTTQNELQSETGSSFLLLSNFLVVGLETTKINNWKWTEAETLNVTGW